MGGVGGNLVEELVQENISDSIFRELELSFGS